MALSASMQTTHVPLPVKVRKGEVCILALSLTSRLILQLQRKKAYFIVTGHGRLAAAGYWTGTTQ